MCTCPRDQGIRVIAMTEPMAIPPSAECTPFMFLPLSAQCPSKGLKFLQMMICSSTTGPCIRVKPTSSHPRSSPHRQTTTSPSCSLTLRMDGFSIVTAHTPVQALWRRLTMTLTHTAPSEFGTFTPLAANRELLLVDRVERPLGTTTLLAMCSHQGRSTVL